MTGFEDHVHRMILGPCPHCGDLPDAVFSPQVTSPPKRDNVSLCAACLRLSIFSDNDGHRRLPTTWELARLVEDPDIRLMIDLARERKGRSRGL